MAKSPSDAGSDPRKQRKVVALEEKVELLGMYHRLRSEAVVAHHFTSSESGVRTIVLKRNFWSHQAAMSADEKNLALCYQCINCYTCK